MNLLAPRAMGHGAPSTKPIPRGQLVATPEGHLFDGVDVASLAAAIGTPGYAYSATEMELRLNYLKALFEARGIRPLIAYAAKANDLLAILTLVSDHGGGIDVVSDGELLKALEAGVPPERIVFSGVGKGEVDHRLAIDRRIRQINVESRPELEQVVQIAASMGRPAPVALRLNPDVGAGTLAQITTGTRHSKFGMAADEVVDLAERIGNSPFLEFRGISVHIGSQITRLAPYAAALDRVAEVVTRLRLKGLEVRAVDVGGGFGISYEADEELDMEGYADLVASFARELQVELVIEPGRWLVGPAGILLTRVLYVKEQSGKRFIVVDAGMNDLLRPALYQAHHAIIPIHDAQGPLSTADVVGPVCESSDVLGVNRALPETIGSGDLLAVLDAGAYGATMGSAYNARRPPAAALLRQGEWLLARRRPSHLEMMSLDTGELAYRRFQAASNRRSPPSRAGTLPAGRLGAGVNR